MHRARKIGLIVNPIAGMGGRVGLKGTDGADVLERALELGAQAEAPRRAVEALRRLLRLKDNLQLLTYPHDMGQNAALEVGISPSVIGSIKPGRTTAADTRRAATDMKEHQVDLLMFVGGDGTARDICAVVGGELVTVGVPAGVKIHSAVFATTPQSAGDLAALFLENRVARVQEAEVMDIDEEAFRAGRVSARLYGYLKVPYEAGMVQSLKAGSRGGEESALNGIALEVSDRMQDGLLYVIGPGTTTRAILHNLGLPKTLLGVDVIQGGRLVAADVGESTLLATLEKGPAKIVVTPIGGQGFIFGRGNQQISPRVIRKVGLTNILVVATMNKLLTLRGSCLLVDTGDTDLDRELSGHCRVITGYRQEVVCKVATYA